MGNNHTNTHFNNIKNTRHYKKAKFKSAKTHQPIKQQKELIPTYDYYLNPLIVLLTLQEYLKDHSLVKDVQLLKIIKDLEKEGKINFKSDHQLSKDETKQVWLYLMRQGNLFCDICGQKITSENDLTYDHHIPQSKGGKTVIENARPAHKLCNSTKGCLLPAQWLEVGEKLLQHRGIQINYLYAGYNYKNK